MTDNGTYEEDEWPHYVHCDQAECPLRWDHWHWRNKDGTRADGQLDLFDVTDEVSQMTLKDWP